MIKIIHTSDWHLGLRFCGYDTTNEYESFIDQLSAAISDEKPDALLLAGDIFDFPVPPEFIFQQFEQYLNKLHEMHETMQIVIIAGNHDDAQWLEKQAKRWQKWSVHIIGQIHKRNNSYDIDRHIVTITDPMGNPKGYIIGIPYTTSENCPILSKQIPPEQRLSSFMTALANRVEMINRTNAPVVMMAHCFVLKKSLPGVIHQKATVVVEDMPLDSIDYFAFGHYHSSKTLGSNHIRSCGSPWPITPKDSQRRSFSVVTIEGRTKEVNVSEHCIKNQCPLVLVPKKPATIDKVLQLLAAFPRERQAFINLHVQTDSNINEKDFIQHCKEINIWGNARLCSIVWVEGNKMSFSHLADTTYLNREQSFSTQKELEVSTLVQSIKKSLNKQLEQIDMAINDLHRREDLYTKCTYSVQKDLHNLRSQSLLKQRYDIIIKEKNNLLSLSKDPQYKWEEMFIDRHQKLMKLLHEACNNANSTVLNDQKKELSNKAIELYKGILHVAFDLKHLKQKIENLKKYLPNKNEENVNADQSIQAGASILLEYQQKESELEEQLQQAQSRIQSIEYLLGISLPKSINRGKKMDNLLKQLNTLQEEALEFACASGQIKDKMTCDQYLIENLININNYHPALWSTSIWKKQEFIDSIIQMHDVIHKKTALYDQELKKLQNKIGTWNVNPALENTVVNSDSLLEHLTPIWVNLFDDLKSQHSVLESQRASICKRIYEIYLLESKLNESEEKEEP